MSATQSQAASRANHEADAENPLARLAQAIEHAAHYLPAQGPINVFIHHNTLHAFEHLPFDEGVQQGARVFGCQPYLTEDKYRERYSQGRILDVDLLAVLHEDLGARVAEPILFSTTRGALRLAMLQHPLRSAPAAELRWFIAQTDALRKFREDADTSIRQRFLRKTRHWVMRDLKAGQRPAGDVSSQTGELRGPAAVAELVSHYRADAIEQWNEDDWEAFSLQALWRVCQGGVRDLQVPPAASEASLRPRDALLAATGVDADQLVNSLLIRFCAAFLDQGFSHWPLPLRDRGFYHSFMSLYGDSVPPDAWLAGLRQEARRIDQSGLSPLQCVRESLELAGVAEENHEKFITESLLVLRGWAGMIRQVELRGDRAAQAIPAESLIEYLAVRLILDRLAASYVAQESLGITSPPGGLLRALQKHDARPAADVADERTFLVFQLAQILGWLPQDLAKLNRGDWRALFHEVEAFPSLERRRALHAAFERRYRTLALDALARHAGEPAAPRATPGYQVACCLDEREESFRRHLEELSPDVETFGAAGFFSVAMYYRGASDANFVPLCPVIVRPQHWVQEDVVESYDEEHRRRAKARKAIGLASHHMHAGSRTIAGGALLAAGIGALATIPLVARVLFPRVTERIRSLAGEFVRPPQKTMLAIERGEVQAGAEPGHYGFSIDEMTNNCERLLRDMGLISNFAPLVFFLGHGSNSVNNPHNSAYNCGACGGSAGGPNGRAIAHMMNDARVRERLKERGIAIPGGTWFVGGFHNTCNDSVTLYDTERVPSALQAEFDRVRRTIEDACDRNAHERCRRFQSAPLTLSYAAARRHVEARSADLAQVRPECGHATNVLCIVGRRERTRGLYLDRRGFLTSYDPTQDDADCTILTRILGAVVPVCGGINLEYYFSYVDNVGFGCGTKLPHNVTSLLGVMDGHASDLRTGLPWQMVEIHEPTRLLMVLETTPEAMLRIMEKNPGIGQPCLNGWVQTATLDPHSGQIHLLRGGRFEPYTPESLELPKVNRSVDWYRGWRDHLSFAQIGQ